MKYAPAETRRILRDRLVRFLPVSNTPALRPSSEDLIPDEQLLNLLLNLNITVESNTDRARTKYDAVRSKNLDQPSFDRLIADGWFRIVWGRIAAPYEIDVRVRATRPNAMTALQRLLKHRFEEFFVPTNTAKSDPALAGLVSRMEPGDAAKGALRRSLWGRFLPDLVGHSGRSGPFFT
ncbi:hypothetical protein [Bradyrhizobium sp. S3.2.12]|uniref:hypothetical protein n=1 Tax=Bradyrhizobium sp. S3.2.12 TaxID=3156387 RepID=UPI0033985829